MGEIFKLMDEMEDELKDARKYAKCYQKHRGDAWGKQFYEMTQDELKHASYIRSMAKDLISEREDSEHLKSLWEYRESWYTDDVTEIKVILSVV